MSGGHAPHPPPGPGFDPDEDLRGLPEPVRRYLTWAIAPGTPRHRGALLRMRGRIRLGRWLPFRATELLEPHAGFEWRARVAGVIGGADRLLPDGGGSMRWRLAGLVPVMRADGPDITLSAAGRAAAESVWLPTTLLPASGVRWSADDDTTVRASTRVGMVPVVLHLRLDHSGRPLALRCDRWGDPAGGRAHGWHPFGFIATDFGAFAGLRIPVGGRVGWFPDDDRFSRGEFLRFHITEMRPVC